MHVKNITEEELADLLADSINLRHDSETGGIAGVSADVRLFTVFQGGFSTSIVLVSELPMPVMPPDPTPEDLEEFEQFRLSMIAEFGDHSAPQA